VYDYWGDTVAVRDYRDNDFNRDRRRRRQKRRVRQGLIKLFVLLCCLIVALLALDMILNESSGAMGRPGRASISYGTNYGTDINGNRGSDASTFANGDGGLTAYGQNYSDPDDTAYEKAWYLILVNKWNYIPDGYEVELTEFENGQLVDKRIYPALQEMFDAARSDEIYPAVVCGYRTTEEQQSLMDEKIAAYKDEGYSAKEAKIKAEECVAIPGTSEHQLGIAVDVNAAWMAGPPGSPPGSRPGDPHEGSTVGTSVDLSGGPAGQADAGHSTDEEVYEWLDQNSYKYGFVRRYSSDKTAITGMVSEPWHYRYVGVEAAAEMYASNLCLEEYLLRYKI